jgi:hypothetical protein
MEFSVGTVIKSASSSTTARENAVTVWMELYRNESPRGVALLKQEAIGSSDPTVRQNLRRALSNAQSLCRPNDRARLRSRGGNSRTLNRRGDAIVNGDSGHFRH